MRLPRAYLACVSAGFGCLGLAACVALPPAATRFAGRIEPETIGGVVCGEGAPATLVVRGGQFSFTPTDGVLNIVGTVAADGTLSGRLSTPGADRKPFTMVLAGRIAGDAAEGTYTTPRCRFRVSLRAH